MPLMLNWAARSGNFTAVLMAERPTPAAVFARLRQHQPTIFHGVPTLFAALLASSDLPRRDELKLRRCISAGEALPAEIGKRWTQELGGRIYSTACVEGRHLYVGCGDSKVYCLDVLSGKTVWSTATENGVDSSPALAGGTVLIGSEDFFFYALEAKTGAVRWKYETGLGISSSPAVSEDLVIVGSKDGFLYAFEIQSGRLRWRVKVSDAVTAPPVVGNGLVCIQAGGTQALDIASGNLVWRAGLGGAVQSAPVLTGDAIYVASNDGEVYALE